MVPSCCLLGILYILSLPPIQSPILFSGIDTHTLGVYFFWSISIRLGLTPDQRCLFPEDLVAPLLDAQVGGGDGDGGQEMAAAFF